MTPDAVPAVELERVRVDFGGYCALEEISLRIAPGEFAAIVGPTGCGKSSILNLVAGLLEPSAGTVQSHGEKVAGVNGRAAYMFQSDALFPWKTVSDNVALGLVLAGRSAGDADAEARRWIARVGLAGLERRYPRELSGGQRRRVAMAQTLINGRSIVLMDEPFSSLDAQTRALMENELLELWHDLRATVLFVTHDLEEAIALSDRVLLVSAGPRARLRGDFPVGLPRPRDVLEMRFAAGFSELYARIWRGLKEEVLKHHAAH
jgi:NitT/TauT family transport system ATP-binding protein